MHFLYLLVLDKKIKQADNNIVMQQFESTVASKFAIFFKQNEWNCHLNFSTLHVTLESYKNYSDLTLMQIVFFFFS